MNTLENISNTIKQSQHDFDKQINKLLAEATILYYEMEYLNKKGVIKQ